MKLIECVNAYLALGELSKQEWSFQDALAIYQMQKALEEKVEFFTRQEQALVKTYGAKDQDGKVEIQPDGTVRLIDPEAARAYAQKRQELMETPVTDIQKATVQAPAVIRPEILAASQAVLCFEAGDRKEA